MSLILATGSNLGAPIQNLLQAKRLLSREFELLAASSMVYSVPVDHTEQPYFYNQVLEFRRPSMSAEAILTILKKIEKKMGRRKTINKGPRLIDIDIIFNGTLPYNSKNLTIPHPSYHQRSFVLDPLKELPFYKKNTPLIKKPLIIDNQSYRL
jgi:2-amino-4-hydroxy-6-hydroxymethyldihydropteridine diphosphokinase